MQRSLYALAIGFEIPEKRLNKQLERSVEGWKKRYWVIYKSLLRVPAPWNQTGETLLHAGSSRFYLSFHWEVQHHRRDDERQSASLPFWRPPETVFLVSRTILRLLVYNCEQIRDNPDTHHHQIDQNAGLFAFNRLRVIDNSKVLPFCR